MNKISSMYENDSRKLNQLFLKRKVQRRGVEEYFNQLTQKSTGIANTNLSKLLRIKHRRKYQQGEVRKITVSLNKKKQTTKQKVKERFSCLINSPGRQSEMSFDKRDTCHSVNSEREKNGLNPLTIFKPLTNKKPNLRLSERTEDIFDHQKTKLEMRNEEKLRHSRQKLSEGGPPPFFKTNVHKFSQTVSDFKAPSEEESLASLIPKFKFNNLKKIKNEEDQSKEDRFEKIKLQKIQQHFMIQPFDAEEDRSRDEDINKRINMTMSKFSFKKQGISQVKRKVSVLCPWEMSNQEFPSLEMI